jgi:hypothetical protein
LRDRGLFVAVTAIELGDRDHEVIAGRSAMNMSLSLERLSLDEGTGPRLRARRPQALGPGRPLSELLEWMKKLKALAHQEGLHLRRLQRRGGGPSSRAANRDAAAPDALLQLEEAPALATTALLAGAEAT